MRRFVAVLPLSLVFYGCDNGPVSPTPPIPTTMPAPEVIAFTMYSGYNGEPVEGASVVIGEKTEVTPSNGTVYFNEPEQEEDITVEEGRGYFLFHATEYRNEKPLFIRYLWAIDPLVPGVTSEYVYALLYKDFFPNNALSRMREESNVCVVPSYGFPTDWNTLNGLNWATGELNRLTVGVEGRITFQYCEPGTPEAEETEENPYVVIKLIVDPEDEWFERMPGAAAISFRDFNENTIIGGTILFREVEYTVKETIGHELGHFFGFGHPPAGAPAGLMGNGGKEFSASEIYSAHMMMRRPPGNTFPDDDRTAQIVSASQAHTTIANSCTRADLK